MIFVGSTDKGYFAKEIAEKNELGFAYVDSCPSIKMQTNLILAHHKQDYTIFDVDQYIDEAEDIAEEIDKICKSNLSCPIIFASGYLPASNMIVELAKRGIKYFILGATLYDMKDQLEKCLNGYYDANGIDIVEEIKQSVLEAEEHINMDCTTIAIVGACNRMGTTTNAIQLIRYLQMNGKRACYIQMNSKDYISSMREWFEIEEEEEIGKITFQNIDHFYKLDNIRDVLNMGYDYFVYDYGVYFDTDFNKVSFLEKDKQIFVVGADQSEMTYTQNIIRSYYYDSVNYIFNFTSDADKQSIREMMQEKADKTFFSAYVPDRYVYVPNSIYETIVPIDEKKLVTEEKRKKGFFKRLKK